MAVSAMLLLLLLLRLGLREDQRTRCQHRALMHSTPHSQGLAGHNHRLQGSQ
jgi:hypothetical protein